MVRTWRQKRGWSQGQLAEFLGTSQKQVSLYERGERLWPRPLAQALIALSDGELGWGDVYAPPEEPQAERVA